MGLVRRTMSALREALTRFILNPANHDVLAIVKGARNGLVYGAKIRFPHALVMVTLFGSGTVRERWTKILTATRQHATRLAAYVAIYKTALLILRDLFHEGKQASVDPFIAGMLGGWYMFGDRTPVNEQVCVKITPDCAVLCVALHCCSAPTRRGAEGLPPSPCCAGGQHGTPAICRAHLGLGHVVVLQRAPPPERRSREQHGLYVERADTDLYVLSDKWNGLRNFLWHNV